MTDEQKEQQKTIEEKKSDEKQEEKKEVESKPVEVHKPEEKNMDTKPAEEKKEAPKPTQEQKKPDNCVYIGGKPFMNYVTAVVMQFTTKNSNEVIVKARGKFISRAVDVTEVATKRFLVGTIELKDIKIDSEDFKNQEGRDIRTSTIEITLLKKQ